MTDQARDVLAGALREAVRVMAGEGYNIHMTPGADRVFAADPRLSEALSLGLAWLDVEAVLPEGASLKVRAQPWNGYTIASAQPVERPTPPFEVGASGDSVALALRALHDRLQSPKGRD